MKINQQIYSFKSMWFEQRSPQDKKPASNIMYKPQNVHDWSENVWCDVCRLGLRKWNWIAMAHLDRQRASHLMSQAGIDGLILFKKKLGDVELIDASEVLAKLKMVKPTGEIENLRKAVEMAEYRRPG